ncbi:MAG: hypothetical protein HOP28_00090 [Gemmatimonadales bacterium]|nr:hypothetical protein [Gemmatimonadales bacterium]
MGDWRIREGECHPVFVYEVGLAVDLQAVARTIASEPNLRPIQTLAGYDSLPAMLRMSFATEAFVIPPFRIDGTIEFVVYEFGAASVGYTIPLGDSPDDLLALSLALRGHRDLEADARRRVEGLVAILGAAIQRPRVAEPVEDYWVVEVRALEGIADIVALQARHGDLIARTLRAAPGPLSAEEVGDALESHLSVGRDDVAFVDWDSALIVDRNPGAIRAVLEFANVQLLELRYLDGQLDQALERSYQRLSRPPGWRQLAPAPFTADLRKISELQLESAMLLERVTNVLKFFAEERSARIYRLAAARLHLKDWDTSITRKLETLNRIHENLSSRAASRRMEFLEWLVILLIATEILLGLAR